MPMQEKTANADSDEICSIQAVMLLNYLHVCVQNDFELASLSLEKGVVLN